MNSTIITDETITEQKVFDYLSNHPEFLVQNPNLLSHLTVPHETGSSISLVERQVKVLRDKNRELQGKLIDMLRTAQDNEVLLAKCIRFILCLLDCQTLHTFSATTIDVLKREFDIDAVKICLFGQWEKVESVKVFRHASELKNELEFQFPDNEPLCGRLDKKLKEKLFAKDDISSGSVAILPLGRAGALGVLTIASYDQTRFSPEMGTLFLELISAIVSQKLIRFKDF